LPEVLDNEEEEKEEENKALVGLSFNQSKGGAEKSITVQYYMYGMGDILMCVYINNENQQ